MQASNLQDYNTLRMCGKKMEAVVHGLPRKKRQYRVHNNLLSDLEIGIWKLYTFSGRSFVIHVCLVVQ